MAKSKSKSKNRKKKYLSLKRHLASSPPSPKTETPSSPETTKHHEKEKPHIFPTINPQDPDRDPNVASLFFSSNNGEAAETLTDILGSASASGSGNPVLDTSSIGSPDSALVGFNGDGLAKRALRGRQRVEYCCSSSSSEEEVASAMTGAGGGVDLWSHGVAKSSPLLKLDYEEILAAWSDRGSLYIDGDGAQIVPESHHVGFPVLVAVSTSVTWTAPTVPETEIQDETKKKGEMETREMRVQRYKEKRRNRLFAKKIRYEVRKLNAEKRPRIKGRFVKTVEDE
ncbi:hypothetical protein LUZ60_015663 [Juncus effusus]|nr:hypothetical protein LUZ60_015663 [Juncus effusus]